MALRAHKEFECVPCVGHRLLEVVDVVGVVDMLGLVLQVPFLGDPNRDLFDLIRKSTPLLGLCLNAGMVGNLATARRGAPRQQNPACGLRIPQVPEQAALVDIVSALERQGRLSQAGLAASVAEPTFVAFTAAEMDLLAFDSGTWMAALANKGAGPRK
jgi:hypothetical protein